MAWREGNRDTFAAGGGLRGIGGFLSGRPVVGAILELLRSGQLGIGRNLMQLGPAMTRTGQQIDPIALNQAIQALIAANRNEP
jgi:hypothetical protein